MSLSEKLAQADGSGTVRVEGERRALFFLAWRYLLIFKDGLCTTRDPWLSLMHIPLSRANRSVGVGRERDGVALSETRAAL